MVRYWDEMIPSNDDFLLRLALVRDMDMVFATMVKILDSGRH